LAKLEKATYFTRMIRTSEITSILAEITPEEYLTCNAYISENDETITIVRDVDDYTVHAIISQFYAHKLCHVTYSPSFAELLD